MPAIPSGRVTRICLVVRTEHLTVRLSPTPGWGSRATLTTILGSSPHTPTRPPPPRQAPLLPIREASPFNHQVTSTQPARLEDPNSRRNTPSAPRNRGDRSICAAFCACLHGIARLLRLDRTDVILPKRITGIRPGGERSAETPEAAAHMAGGRSGHRASSCANVLAGRPDRHISGPRDR